MVGRTSTARTAQPATHDSGRSYRCTTPLDGLGSVGFERWGRSQKGRPGLPPAISDPPCDRPYPQVRGHTDTRSATDSSAHGPAVAENAGVPLWSPPSGARSCSMRRRTRMMPTATAATTAASTATQRRDEPYVHDHITQEQRGEGGHRSTGQERGRDRRPGAFPTGHAPPSTGAMKRYPCPVTVSIQRGTAGSSPSTRRSSAIRLSTVHAWCRRSPSPTKPPAAVAWGAVRRDGSPDSPAAHRPSG